MKILHILEAQSAVAHGEFKQLAGKPKLQREGDFVWHLYKFYDQGPSDTHTNKNPEYRKALIQIIKIVLKKWKANMASKPQNTNIAKGWAKLDINKAAGPIASGIEYNEPQDFVEEPFDPDIYDNEAEWQNDVRWEREQHNEYQGARVSNVEYDIKHYWKIKKDGDVRYWTPHHSLSKMFKAVSADIKMQVEKSIKQLPPPTIPKATKATFTPKKGIAAFVDGHHIGEVRARLDKDGIITSAAFELPVSGSQYRDSKQYIVKGVAGKSPAELREILKYYREHSDW